MNIKTITNKIKLFIFNRNKLFALPIIHIFGLNLGLTQFITILSVVVLLLVGISIAAMCAIKKIKDKKKDKENENKIIEPKINNEKELDLSSQKIEHDKYRLDGINNEHSKQISKEVRNNLDSGKSKEQNSKEI